MDRSLCVLEMTGLERACEDAESREQGDCRILYKIFATKTRSKNHKPRHGVPIYESTPASIPQVNGRTYRCTAQGVHPFGAETRIRTSCRAQHVYIHVAQSCLKTKSICTQQQDGLSVVTLDSEGLPEVKSDRNWKADPCHKLSSSGYQG